ncbi:MAG: TIGR02147 family protein [Bacteriovorax sp.]|nr:TIGR02147 family protein [Bacteriovorax sp.]
MENKIVTIHKNLIDDERTMFRLWLQKNFTERCKKNARYSLRAFAKNLDLDPSSLSQVLSGKRKLSKKMIQAICEKLSASPKELERFGLVKKMPGLDDDFMQVNIDTFSVISEWYHYAILELTYVSGFKADAKWIAKKLSITVEEAKSATERLKRLGLLLEEGGSLIKSSRLITNNGNVNSSGAHKELQKQVITKALIAVDECSAEEKDITSMTMAIDRANIEKARFLIQKFRRDLCALLEDGDQTCVYNLGIQLYPISKTQENL